MKDLQKPKKKVELKLKINVWKVIFAFSIIFLLAPVFGAIIQTQIGDNKVELSKALNDIREKKIDKVEIQKEKIILYYKDKSIKITTKEENQNFPDLLDKSKIDPAGVNFTVIDQSITKAVAEILGTLLPLVLMAAFFYFIFRAQNKGAQDIFSFGRSKAKLFAKGRQNVTFADVAGVDDAKKELEEVVDFLKNPAKYQRIGARTPKGAILFGPAGVGKCVTGDTLVWTIKGLMEIQDVPKYFAVEESGVVHGAKVSSFLPDTANPVISEATHWYDLGINDTVEIKTTLGHKIEGTPEHPLVVVDKFGKLKFREAGKIKVGDWIPIKTGDQIFGTYKKIDKEGAYVLGLLTGDGGLTIKDRICFTTADKQILASFKNYFKDTFLYEVKKTSSRKYDYVITSAEIKSKLISQGLSENFSRNKKIPEYIMMSPKEQIVSFLQGLFDTDGSVYKTGKVEYATSSEKLARQVSALLLNLGIMHKFRIRGNNQYANSYQILISGLGLLVFVREIGFRLKRKQLKLHEYIRKIKSRTNIDLIPNQGKRIRKIWRYLVDKRKKPSLVIFESFHKDIIRYAKGERKPSAVSLRLFIDSCEKIDPEINKLKDFNYLKSLSYSGLFFDRVNEIKRSQNRVYDFTVPVSHSFISNGFISHNTLLARAVAGEAGVPFFSMAGSEFMEMLVGVGASRVRDLFAQAKASAPSIIFIDEIDAIGRSRGRGGFVGGHDEREQTLNQILVEMDGFTPNDNVIVMAATNRGDLLDPALLRPGRFDRRVMLDMPDKEGREAILKIHAKGKKFAKDINWGRISDRTVGFSGADLENMLNEAAIFAARTEKREIDMEDVEEAATKVKLGPAKKRLQSEEDKKITAYHEAGHGIVTHVLPKMDPVHRISIVARGMSLGHTLIPPAADRTHETRSRMLQQITAMLGGRAAEELVFNEMTSGASNDIEKATSLARAMVIEFGMSSLGPINFGPQTEFGDFGSPEWYEPSQISQSMQKKVDIEIKKIMDFCYKEAVALVKKYRKPMDEIVAKLLEKETLDRDEFEKIVGKKK